MKIGVIQINSINDLEVNKEKINFLIRSAVLDGAKAVFLPEVAFFRGASSNIAEAIPGHISGFLSCLAKELNIWIHSGSIAEKVSRAQKPFNTSFVVNPAGKITAKYRKIHLFETLLKKDSICESNFYAAGNKITLAEIKDWRVGMTICFDLRFSSLWTKLRQKGAELFTVPANFTYRTGKDHWEILLRSRAIEFQSYVVASAQWGEHIGKNFSAIGRAVINDPWGQILAEAPIKGDCVILADIDKRYLNEVRETIPMKNA